MTSFNATHAFDIGYGMAVKGFSKIVPGGTWLTKFGKDWVAGWEMAVEDGKWNTWC